MSEIDKTAEDLSQEVSRVISQSTHVQTEEQMQAVRLDALVPLTGLIQIDDYDPAWPRLFEREAERIRIALGDRALLIEHVGSTSVPGLAAKPKIDILLR